ncbi:aldo/keto reductase [Desulforhopalus singaporensis]|uniref:Alcohol dehydrogenase (NADP+) n=1 Tax=Desulforhopalus singaporensis TaxID=91360 RepID=A0A1H0S5G5_9BACT|nr:aldo/keto reductase [Desulforhopalus singaporensis]SDP36980.1 alcohol dehydrogenase (NADP+) [Desulforhopalus singaporensis]
MKYYTLNNSLRMPALGLGTWKSKSGEAKKAVTSALEAGYLHIDCAPIYKNEKEIGEALHGAVTGNIVTREKLWVTSKLWNNAHAPRHVRPALERTLSDLQLEYLDLFLIHWPVHFRQDIEFPRKPEEFLHPDDIEFIETWQAMEKMVKKGLCRAIGVCNFSLLKLKTLVSQAAIPPAVNQIELHPYLPQPEMVAFCSATGIVPTAFSPLGSPDRPAALKKSGEPVLLDHPEILDIATQAGCTPAQLLIRWALHRNCAVIPKSTHPARIRENLEAQELVVDRGTLQKLDSISTSFRFVDGAFFCSPGSPYSLDYLWNDE